MSRYNAELENLVNDMGFNRMEASMALDETAGNMNDAIKNLLAGKYAPPPYQQEYAAPELVKLSENNRIDNPSKKKFSNLLADLRGKHKAPVVNNDHPTAPSIVDLPNEFNKFDLPNGVKELPPPYDIMDKTEKIKDWEKDLNVFYFDAPNNANKVMQSFSRDGTTEDRCDACFNILENFEDVLYQGRKIYHGQCFRKKYGPKCSYCCFPLTMPDKDHDLSGRYMVYQNKDYHVECYEKYAGPRCSQCFNVIIERINGEFSGNWIVDGNYQYHVECYRKKLNTQWRVKHS